MIKDSAQASNLKSVTLLHEGDAIVTNAIIHTVKHQITPAKRLCVCAYNIEPLQKQVVSQEDVGL